MAATGQGQQGEAQTGQQGEAQQGDGGQPDWGALTDTLGQLGQGQSEMREMLQGWQQQGQQDPQQQQQPAEQPAELDLSWLDSGDPEYDRQVAQRMGQAFETAMQQREQNLMQQVEERFGALDERLTDSEYERQFTQLASEFEELQNPETVNQVNSIADQYVDACGWPESMKGHPQLLRLVYMAGRAADAAQEEGQQQQEPGGSGAAHLEGGGGANPGAGGQVDAGDEWIRAAQSEGRGHRALPFH